MHAVKADFGPASAHMPPGQTQAVGRLIWEIDLENAGDTVGGELFDQTVCGRDAKLTRCRDAKKQREQREKTGNRSKHHRKHKLSLALGTLHCAGPKSQDAVLQLWTDPS